jgi:3-oxoacyl-[acyl-carrier-protein] synthase III
MIRAAHPQRIGISAIAAYEPPWLLGNDWFSAHSEFTGGGLTRKFVHHTGILSRHISTEDEVAIGIRAVESLMRESNCDLRNCRGIVFASPSIVPGSVARRAWSRERGATQRVPGQFSLSNKLALSPCRVPSGWLPAPSYLQSASHAAQELAARLRQISGADELAAEHVYGINWGCSGYSKAMAIVYRHILPAIHLRQDQFVMVVTASRISRITNYGCKQTAPLFGDMATVTLLAPLSSERYPVHFELILAGAGMRAAERVYFDYHVEENVSLPTPDGGRSRAARRLVFSLDGLGIAEAAPRAMAATTVRALKAARIEPEDVQFLVPHQAGTGIVRFTEMKLQELGIQGEVINGLTRDVGNVSSCSIPYALRKSWETLRGTIVCPTAGVGQPGDARVSQGCVILQSTARHG